MRRWFTPRALGLGVIALALMTAMGALGFWQLGAYDKHRNDAASAMLHQPPAQLDSVLGPDAAFPASGVGQPVTARGRYDATDQLYVRGLPGVPAAYAVVTPLITPSGSMILVVRGASKSLQTRPPAGEVTVRGILEPSQATGDTLDRRRVTNGIRIASLLNSVHRDLYAGYVVLSRSSPPEHLPAVVPPVPDASRWVGLRNLLYAIQWWVFAGFVGFMWWRVVSDAPAQSAHGSVGYGRSP